MSIFDDIPQEDLVALAVHLAEDPACRRALLAASSPLGGKKVEPRMARGMLLTLAREIKPDEASVLVTRMLEDADCMPVVKAALARSEARSEMSVRVAAPKRRRGR